MQNAIAGKRTSSVTLRNVLITSCHLIQQACNRQDRHISAAMHTMLNESYVASVACETFPANLFLHDFLQQSCKGCKFVPLSVCRHVLRTVDTRKAVRTAGLGRRNSAVPLSAFCVTHLVKTLASQRSTLSTVVCQYQDPKQLCAHDQARLELHDEYCACISTSLH